MMSNKRTRKPRGKLLEWDCLSRFRRQVSDIDAVWVMNDNCGLLQISVDDLFADLDVL